MIESSGKKLKTLAEHKAGIEKKKEEFLNETTTRRAIQENKERIQQEKSVRKW
jgi:hypothetical protein